MASTENYYRWFAVQESWLIFWQVNFSLNLACVSSLNCHKQITGWESPLTSFSIFYVKSCLTAQPSTPARKVPALELNLSVAKVVVVPAVQVHPAESSDDDDDESESESDLPKELIVSHKKSFRIFSGNVSYLKPPPSIHTFPRSSRLIILSPNSPNKR